MQWAGAESRSSIPAATERALRSLVWVGRAENLVVAGPRDTGKSHLLEAIGHHAIDQGLTVAWFSLENLGVIVRRHRVDDTVSKAFAALASTSLTAVDDIGLLPISADAAEGLYRVVDAAYERGSLALSTNDDRPQGERRRGSRRRNDDRHTSGCRHRVRLPRVSAACRQYGQGALP